MTSCGYDGYDTAENTINKMDYVFLFAIIPIVITHRKDLLVYIFTSKINNIPLS